MAMSLEQPLTGEAPPVEEAAEHTAMPVTPGPILVNYPLIRTLRPWFRLQQDELQ